MSSIDLAPPVLCEFESFSRSELNYKKLQDTNEDYKEHGAPTRTNHQPCLHEIETCQSQDR